MDFCIFYIIISFIVLLIILVTPNKYYQAQGLLVKIYSLGCMLILCFVLIGFLFNPPEVKQTYTFITMDGKEKTNGYYCDSTDMTCRVGNKVYQVKEFEANKQE
ncbi:MAG: hypothetical protein RSC93_02590 [Erysipelotrichaceae bacterium]